MKGLDVGMTVLFFMIDDVVVTALTNSGWNISIFYLRAFVYINLVSTFHDIKLIKL